MRCGSEVATAAIRATSRGHADEVQKPLQWRAARNGDLDGDFAHGSGLLLVDDAGECRAALLAMDGVEAREAVLANLADLNVHAPNLRYRSVVVNTLA